jgi:transposase
LKGLALKLGRSGGELRFCHEAGPCGYGIQRQRSAAGHECAVVAPSLIPRKPGDRIKTDRRDAINLAKLHRAGELTSVWVPDQAHEAIRDLVRARLAAVRTLRQARQQLSLSAAPRPSLQPTGLDADASALAGRVAVRTTRPPHCAGRLYRGRRGGDGDRLEGHIEVALPDWSLAPVVRALQLLRGMALVAAATVVAEPGDITRFAIRASSWHILAWCRPRIPAAARAAKAPSPRPGTEAPGAC